MLLSFLIFSVLAAIVGGVPSAKYIQHEKRSSLPHGWHKHERLPGSYRLPMRIALVQSNLHKGYNHLLDVSHPESPNYGKHWSAHQVAEAFAPKQETVDSVLEWLKSSDISEDRITKSQSLGWLHFNATAREAENLLKTRYHIHRHTSGKPHIACESYRLPEHVRPHVDFITPTVHFDTKVAQVIDADAQPTTGAKAAVGVPVKVKAGLQVTEPTNGFLPKKGAEIDVESIIDELGDCSVHITPNCLRALYRFPPGFTANPQNSLGVVA